MGTITLPNFRTTADVTMNTRLKDGGVSIDWAGLTNIKAWLFSDAQKALAGRCDVSINQADSTLLVCEYSASKPQYLGVNRLIVQAKYQGRTKTYDVPVFNFVSRTAAATGTVTIDDPTVDVEIVVEDVSSSILDNIIAAALDAAARAEAAAQEAEHMVDIHTGPEGKSAYEVAVAEGYTGTEEEWLASLIGQAGESAYQLAVDQGYEGTLADWLASLKGPAGDSAYQVAVEEGFVGTKAQWLASLVGPQGLSAYQVAVVEGFEGSVSDWLASLVGPVGPTPAFSVGTVQTGAAGTQAAASITGTAEAPVLNLIIPRGDTGVAPEDLQDAVDEYLEDHPTVSGTFLNVAKHKLISLLQKVAFIDTHGQDYIDELSAFLFLSPIDHIDAVFTQGSSVIYDIYDLDDLKSKLVVTVYYVDGSHAVVSDYELSGTLVGGTSTITVSVLDSVTGNTFTDTFNVTVTATTKLYVSGDECSALTGGWQNKGFNNTNGSPTVAKEASDLLIRFGTSSSSAAAKTWSTVNKIDITGKTQILIQYELYNETGTAGFYAYYPGTLSESTSQSGAFGSDYSSNRSGIRILPNSGITYESQYRLRSITATRTNAYISLNLNCFSADGAQYSAGAYVKIKKVALV